MRRFDVITSMVRAGGMALPRVAVLALCTSAAWADPDPLDAKLGAALFEKLWVAAPSSTLASDGLGPLYNTRACTGCHVDAGRGVRPEAGETTALIASFPDPDPIYGAQVQTRATQGLTAEAALSVSYFEAEHAGVALRAPRYGLVRQGYGEVTAPMSVRLSPPLAASAAMAAVPHEAVRAWADPEDADGDGISGRLREAGDGRIGRFGYKADHPDLHHQTATAFSRDLGLSSPLHPDAWGDCTEAQAACRARPHGDGDARVYEVDATVLDLTVDYLESLAVEDVVADLPLFSQIGCAACHVPSVETARGDVVRPFTDLLLHDMGAGLAEEAGGDLAAEWRTAPLSGLRLTVARGETAAYLHDGRARTLEEAIAWHGGEGAASRDAYFALPDVERARILNYLESL